VKRRFTVPRHALPRAIIFAVCAALIPLPVTAAESKAPAKTPQTAIAKSSEPKTLRAAIENVDLRDLKAPAKTEPASRRSAQGADTVKQSPTFFKTGPGIAVLAIAGAGIGYALYSTSHDRIHSPGRN
jgi:hypothetical protein